MEININQLLQKYTEKLNLQKIQENPNFQNASYFGKQSQSQDNFFKSSTQDNATFTHKTINTINANEEVIYPVKSQEESLISSIEQQKQQSVNNQFITKQQQQQLQQQQHRSTLSMPLSINSNNVTNANNSTPYQSIVENDNIISNIPLQPNTNQPNLIQNFHYTPSTSISANLPILSFQKQYGNLTANYQIQNEIQQTKIYDLENELQHIDSDCHVLKEDLQRLSDAYLEKTHENQQLVLNLSNKEQGEKYHQDRLMSLEKILQEKDQQIREINQVKDSQIREINQVKDSQIRDINQVKESQIKEIKQELKNYEEKAQSETKQLSKQLMDTRVEFASLESKYLQCQSERDSYKAQIVNLKEQIDGLIQHEAQSKSFDHEREAVILQLKHELELVCKGHIALSSSSEEQRKKDRDVLEQLNEQNALLTSNINQLKHQIQSQQTSACALEEKMRILEQNNKQIYAQKVEMQKRVEEQQTIIDEHVKIKQSLELRLSDESQRGLQMRLSESQTNSTINQIKVQLQEMTVLAQNKSARIEQLQKEKKQLEDLKSQQNDSFLKDLVALQSGQAARDFTIKQLRLQKETLENRVQSLQDDLAVHQNTILSLDNENQILKQQIAKNKETTISSTEALMRYEQYEARVDELKKAMGQMQQDCILARSEAQGKAQEVTSLQNQVFLLQRKIEDMSKVHTNNIEISQKEHKERETMSLQQQKFELESKYSLDLINLESKYQKIQEELRANQRRENEYQDIIQTQQTKQYDLEQNKRQLEHDKFALSSALEVMKTNCDEVMRTVVLLKSENERMHAIVDGLQYDLGQKARQNEDLETICASLANDVKTFESKNIQIQLNYNSLEQSLMSEQKQKQALQLISDELKFKMTELQQQNSMLNDLDAMIGKQKDQLFQVQNQLNVKCSENNQLMMKLSEFQLAQQMLAEYEETVQVLKQENIYLNQQLMSRCKEIMGGRQYYFNK